MPEAIDRLYAPAAKTVEDEARALDERTAPQLRQAEAVVRDEMDAWVRDRLAAIAHTLTGHTPHAQP